MDQTQPKRHVVICPYCRKPATLRMDSAHLYGGKDLGPVWDCRSCDAYVGVHKNSRSFMPFGRLANAELRRWRMKAHHAFDPLWKEHGMTRAQAYRWMCDALGMTKSQAHIAKFDVPECRRLVEMVLGGSWKKT